MKPRSWFPFLLASLLVLPGPVLAQDEEVPELTSSLVSDLTMRNIGSALMSGRILEVVVDPVRESTWYIAVASGGVWKTDNAGVTWRPIFDNYGSYSIGTVAVDPNDRFTVWVGTGENNSQRSVGYGDGIYKSIDGGSSFEKVGLESSEHIARILVDPRDSDRVFVASQGPLWSSGGDRGVFRTEDGGGTWDNVLAIDENTGVSDLVVDPRNPDVMYASAYQRRRHVWTLIDGGPESGVWKTEDGGDTWREINKGLPSGDKGRIGLAISPSHPDILYAIIELADGGGTWASTNGGENWARRGDYVSGSPQYYNEIYVDLNDPDRIYSLDTYMMVSEDGGRSFQRLGEEDKHVDNHALWIDPGNTDHLLIGSDGGLYETWDRGRTYRYFTNLPLSQYYRVAVSNDEPFYFVYGGTQDNATHGGPSRTTNTHGIRNSDWFVTVFGDGFGPAIDPEEPNIVYSQWQHGGLIRFDRANGEQLDIKPREAADGPPLRWNWDSPLLISPHDNERLYFGAQMLFRSDDRGHSWTAVSGDLTRQMDRNELEVMGRVWSVDAVAKNRSTSVYGNLVSVSESPLVEGLIYTGADDGLMNVTADGGENWTALDPVEGVPELTYVNDIEASLHDADVVYAAFNNHKMGDFAPYLFKSADRGQSWASIASDLPERGTVYTVVQDHVNPSLLFAGTEFGIFFTVDEGGSWTEITGGMPTVGVRDLVIQRRESDLVAASFGRGFYVLDDYSPLRTVKAVMQEDAHLFPVKTALAYHEDTPLGVPNKAFQGADFYTAPNPAFGATFTYYLADGLKSRQDARQAAEKELASEGEDTPYPSWEELKAEDREEEPAIVLTVRTEGGDVVRRLTGPEGEGVHRVSWDLLYPGYTNVSASTGSDGNGPMAVPGTYTVEVAKWVDGSMEALAGPVSFQVEALGIATLPQGDATATLAFQQQVGGLQRAVMGTNAAMSEAMQGVRAMKNAIERAPERTDALRAEARDLEVRLMDLQEVIQGDLTLPRRNEPGMPGIMSRIQTVVGGTWSTSSAPTATHREQYGIASDGFSAVVEDIRQLVDVDVPALESRLEAMGIRWTTGRGVPSWSR
jgi:photosystem II stability/assembly factor-like uncharacterized protein